MTFQPHTGAGKLAYRKHIFGHNALIRVKKAIYANVTSQKFLNSTDFVF